MEKLSDKEFSNVKILDSRIEKILQKCTKYIFYIVFTSVKTWRQNNNDNNKTELQKATYSLKNKEALNQFCYQ